jgi:hypothetical protein
MAVFRVPFPDNPERRRRFFDEAQARLAGVGVLQGTPEAAEFHGQLPVGRFAGSYRIEPGSGVLEVDVRKKPLIVPMSLLESEARKFIEAL